MKPTTRRTFIMRVAAGSSVLAASGAMAQTPKVNEKDPQAVGLAYVADATKVDKKRFPKFTAEQKCSTCQLYTAKATDPAGPCALFPGKHVAGPGWCSAYVKKV